MKMKKDWMSLSGQTLPQRIVHHFSRSQRNLQKIKRCRASESELKLQGFCGDCITLTHTKLGTHLDSWIGSLENTEKRTDLTWQ
jgi:hypothetical protein